MNLATMTAEVYALLDVGSVNNDRLTVGMVQAMLNDEYGELAARVECFVRSITLTTSAGVATYALPGDVVRPAAVRYGDTVLHATTAALLDLEFGGGWRTAPAGSPRAYYCPTVGMIGLCPAPDGTAAVLIDAVVAPSGEAGGIPLLAADEDTPALPARYHLALVYGVVARACNGIFAEADGGPVRAQWAVAMRERLIQAFAEARAAW